MLLKSKHYIVPVSLQISVIGSPYKFPPAEAFPDLVCWKMKQYVNTNFFEEY
jgi:hypothetical protein